MRPFAAIRPLRACTTDVHAGEACVRAALAERSDGADDQAGMTAGEFLGTEPDSFGEAGAEVHERHVGVLEEGIDDGSRVGVAEVQRQRALAPVAGDEGARLHRRERAEDASRVAIQGFDLDDIRAAFGEQLGAEGNGDELAELDDADAVEGLVGGLGGHWGNIACWGGRAVGGEVLLAWPFPPPTEKKRGRLFLDSPSRGE